MAAFDDGKLKIAVEWRRRDRFPIRFATHCWYSGVSTGLPLPK